jgi:peroxiredoxin
MAIAAFTCLLLALAAHAATPDDATKVSPLEAGATAPDFIVRNADGSDHRFQARELNKPVVLIFYRGGWCAYCNAHLGALKKLEADLIALGFDLYFLSADKPSNLYSSLKEPDIHYTLLSDARMTAARAFGVAFRVDNATIEKYKSFGVDLEAASGETHHELPIPAVFIVDKHGVIRFVHANPDFRVRIAPEELLAGAKKVVAEAQ